MKGRGAAEGIGPRVTKPYPRERDARERRTKNPREEFEVARKRGLTEQEVRGIVEEFVDLGFTQVHGQNLAEEEYAKIGELARGWYCDALVEGFSLTEIQEVVLMKMLRQVGKEDAASFSLRLKQSHDLKNQVVAGEHGFEDSTVWGAIGINPMGTSGNSPLANPR